MRISVLGPLVLQRDGETITPSAPKPRKILSLLLLNANQVVPVASFFEELWDDRPPPSAQTTLQTYILQIRRLIDGKSSKDRRPARDILATEAGGYTFRIQPETLDLHEYTRIATEGRRALAERHWQAAAESLREALALWRGPTLADVRAGRMLLPQIIGLNESRLTAIEQCMEASIKIGRHLEVLNDLTALVAEHRFHENLHAQLMLALHRSGRRQDALAIFQRLRSALVGELGLEPSQPLHVLQHAIACDDPMLHA